MTPKYPLRYLKKDQEHLIPDNVRGFGPYGNLTGMRKNNGWEDAKPVKCGAYVYDVPTDLYWKASERP